MKLPPIKTPTWPGVRNGLLFFTGLGGIAFEVFFRRPPDYGLLPALLGMVGLPSLLTRDERSSDPDHNGSPYLPDDAPPGGAPVPPPPVAPGG